MRILILILSIQQLLFLAVDGYTIPAPFNDSKLPLEQRTGDWVDHLGHIIKLNTVLGPNEVERFSTKFKIYTRQSESQDITFTPGIFCFPNNCNDQYQYDLSAMSASGFKPDARTVIMISGYRTKDYVDWMNRAKNLWLLIEDINVILVTWSSAANELIYSSAVANTPLVARQITIFLHYLAEMNGQSLYEGNFATNIHFIGHSLGAHIAGFTGQDLSGRLGRITGLDPAGPSFDRMPRNRKLDQSDALLVDVIHTNSGKIHYLNAAAFAVVSVVDSALRRAPILKSLPHSLSKDYSGEGATAYFGIDEQVGHIDFYANNGRVQPGCSGIMHLCDHGRSHEIFEGILRHESIMRRYSASSEWLKQNRLLAFKATDYEAFSSGNSFDTQCPLLLRGREYLNEDHDKTFAQCSVPMDLITPVEELRQELSNEYNVNFGEGVNLQTNRKYYFKTHSEEPFVGFHNLLKIHLDKSYSWDSSCALRAKITMNSGVSTTVELNKELHLVKSNDFFGIAMPFVNPLGPEARIAYDFILNNPKSLSDSDIFDVLNRILPSEVNVEISGAASTGILEVFKNRLYNLGFSNKASSKCNLEVLSIEVHQVDGAKRSIAGLYGASKNFKDNLRARVVTFREYSSMVRNSYQLAAPRRPSITELLDTILVTT